MEDQAEQRLAGPEQGALPTTSTASSATVDVSPPKWLCDVCKEQSFLDFEEAAKHEKTCPGPGTTVKVTQEVGNGEESIDQHSVSKPSVKSDTATSSSSSKATIVSPADANPFFVPLSKKQKSKERKTISTTTNEEKKSKLPVNPFFAPKTNKPTVKTSTTLPQSNTQPAKKNPKRKKASSQCNALELEGDGSVLREEQSPQRTKKSIAKQTNPKRSKKNGSLTTSVELDLQATPQLAAIFQHKSSKEIVAEQKQAEFQAKREAERQRERERQAKRAAMFGGASHQGQKAHGVLTLGSGGSLKRKHPQSKTEATSIQLNHLELPLAPRFPVPNHIFEEHSSIIGSTPVCLKDIVSPDHAFRKHSTPPVSTGSPDTIRPSMKNDESLGCSLSELDVVEELSMSPAQQALQKFLLPPSRNNVAGSPLSENHTRMWVDKYGMEHGLVGVAPAKTCQELVEYVNHWRKVRKEAMERMAERQRKRKAKFDKAMGKKVTSARKPKRKKKTYGSDEDDHFLEDDDEYWDDDEIGNHNTPLCLLLGPPSSGKTAMVHHVAKQCLCSVVEINTSEVRSGAALKNAIEEATKSSSLDTMLSTKENQSKSNFFAAISSKPAKRVIADSDDEVEDEKNTGLSLFSKKDRDESSMTLVLIDEADIVFDSEGDSGFWGALTTLSKTAKSPIVLTANHCPAHLLHNSALPFRCFEVERPTPRECASKILQICRHEGMNIKAAVKQQGAAVIQDMLIDVASSCDCDLRRLMYELQLYASSSSKSDDVPAQVDAENKTELVANSRVHDWKPSIASLQPRQASMDKYTVLTVKGRNFGILENSATQQGSAESDFLVWIGNQRCPNIVVDDETLLVLCPPYAVKQEDSCETFCGRLMKRVLPLSIDFPALGLSKTNLQRTVQTETLVNGATNIGSQWVTIEYIFPEDFNARHVNESNDSIEEFELDEGGEKEADSEPLAEIAVQSSEDGLVMWQNVISKVKSDKDVSKTERYRSSAVDAAVEIRLRECCLHAMYGSDAAFLDDFQDGIPYLAGACRGFGFDLTEDCMGYSTRGDKLRLHENHRPPHEEKLFEMGWKDNCYFYGDPDTYVTQLSLKSGKAANFCMQSFRGQEFVEDPGHVFASAPAIPPDEIEDLGDLDFIAHHPCNPSLEDMYLPQHVSELVRTLPQLLRKNASTCRLYSELKSQEFDLFERQRKEKMELLLSRASYVLPETSDGSAWTYGRLGLVNSSEQAAIILELLPSLRRIGLYEQAAEFAAMEAGKDAAADTSCRRTTRRQAKARRHHYFDKISSTLRRDEADLNSSELGALMAQDILVYSGMHPNKTE